jgi:hypothetical protein
MVIRIKNLPLDENPAPTDLVAVDGPTTRRTTIEQLVAASGLGELAATAVQPEDLGTSAPLDVGTTAETVAAGDDERIVGALQSGSNLADLDDAAAARQNLGLDTVYLRLVSRGYYDIQTDFGAPGAGSDYTALLGAMIDACMSTGNPGHIRPGIFNITGPIIKTFFFDTQEFELIGFGERTRINFLGSFAGNSGNAITINYLGRHNAMKLRNMVFQTDDQSTSVTALNLICPAQAAPSYARNTELDRITFKGTDGWSTAKHFKTALKTMRVSNVFVDRCAVYGPGTGIGDANGRGTMLDFQSDAGNYAVKYSVKRSKFFQFGEAIRLGNYVQELVVDDTEIVGGGIGVMVPSGQLANDGIAVNGSHINARLYGMLVEAVGAANLAIGAGTYFILNAKDATGVSYAGELGRIVGAGFARTTGAVDGQVAVRLASGAKDNIVSSNSITNMATGVSLNAGSERNTVQGNKYRSVTTPYIDNGTGNSVGVATA